MRRRFLRILLVSILLGGLMTMTACSKTAEREVTLHFPKGSFNTDTVDVTDFTVVWKSEDYENSTDDYNRNIARVCAALSASAGSSEKVQENLSSLGFSHLSKFCYEDRYRGDKTGVAIGSMRLGDKTLVALILRGTTGREWYSNFDVGYDEVHEGFSSAADYALDRLDMYLTNYEIDRDAVKFIVTGYSRGGAVANLAAKNLIDACGKENVFAYTFASPNTTTDDDENADYDAIFNLVKSDDFFTYVPPASWGYHRYGTDIVLTPSKNVSTPDERETAAADDLPEYLAGSATPDSAEILSVFGVLSAETADLSREEKIDNFLDEAAALAPGVDDYYNSRIAVGDDELSLFELMSEVAGLLAGDESFEDSPLFFEALTSDYAGIAAFFMDGVNVEEIFTTGEMGTPAIAKSHFIEGYIDSMDNL